MRIDVVSSANVGFFFKKFFTGRRTGSHCYKEWASGAKRTEQALGPRSTQAKVEPAPLL